MSAFWTLIVTFLIGNAAGIIEMAILGGMVDKWLDQRAKKKGR